MKNREELIEQYEDALFALLMYDVAQAEGEEALRLNELLKEDPDAALPESLQRRCEKTIRNAFAKQNMKRAGRTAGKVIQRVSVAAMLVMLLFTTAFAVSEDFRIATLNAVIQVFDDRTRITFQGTSTVDRHSNASEGLDYQYNIALDWLPEGYEVEGGWTTENGTSDHIAFIDQSGSTIDIDFTPYTPGLIYTFDSEACTKKEITVQGCIAELYIKNEDALHEREQYGDMPQIWSDMTIFWEDNTNQVVVLITATNLSEKEMLRLAEGIHWHG